MDYNKGASTYCHQYNRRLEAEKEDFNNVFLRDKLDNTDLSLKNAVVKPIKIKEAKVVIEKYEYLGGLAAFNKFAFGLFFDNLLSGVVVFGNEYSINLPFWEEKYEMNKDNTILLNRGVCTWWCPKNANSFLVSKAIELLPDNYKVITCTVDPLAKERGIIYQACNFNYVGSMRDSNPNIKNKSSRDRTGCIIDGKLYTSRSLRNKFGTMKKDIILEIHPNAEFIKVKSKHRYFYFRGSKSDKRFFKNKIKNLIKPYPKDYIE
ncbi:MAG: hypothetical protein KC414_13705 [Romboutsia sp.]|nr:hypothetical protein [Romboutsia sp.]